MSENKLFDYSGESYEAEVPDTLDLADNAALAINCLGGTIDPELDYLPFGWIDFTVGKMYHSQTVDVGCVPKYAESFPMMRVMSGSQQYLDIEAKVREMLLARIDDDLYWHRFDPRYPWQQIYTDSLSRYGKPKKEDFCVPLHAGRMLRAVLVWRNVCDDPMLDEVAGSLVRGLRRIAIDKDDYSYYPEKGGWSESTSYPRSGWRNTDESQGEIEGTEGSITCYSSQSMHGPAHWYDVNGDPVALELATRFARYCMKPKFWGGVPDPKGGTRPEGCQDHVPLSGPDPAYTAGAEQGHWFNHFHSKAHTLRGILAYAHAASDERAMEFVRRAYEYTLTQGIARIGWVCNPGPNNCEGCSLGDIIALGIRLSDMGLGDYWDDVDAVTRNHLVGTQLTNRELIGRVNSAWEKKRSEEKTGTKESNHLESCIYGPGIDITDSSIERLMGMIFGFSKPTSVSPLATMICCIGNATQGLYYAWEGALRENGDNAQVNLLLNRAAKLLDVDSYLPYEGKVVLRNKAARRISVRIPYWVDRRKIRANVSGHDTSLDWLGNNLIFSSLKPNDVITITFPVKETTSSYTANAHTDDEQVYKCTFRGSTCVDISPRDEEETSYPMYLREHMRKDKAPMKKKTRFVADKKILNW